MQFDKNQVEEYYKHIQPQSNFPNDYISELFLIGKITEDENIHLEVTEILNQIASKEINKVFKGRTKIYVTGKHTDYEKCLQSLITLGKKAEDLDIGKMFLLLGYDDLRIYKAALIKKVEQNPWIFERLDYVKTCCFFRETFPSGIIPNSIGRLKGLEELDFHKTEAFIPSTIGNLKNLKTLRISGKYTSIPDSIGDLPNLKKLRLTLPCLEKIPDSIQNLKQLEELEIAGDGFSSGEYNNTVKLPSWISKLENLKSLKFGYLALKEIPSDIFPPNLEKLRIYRMHGIQHLPETISSITSLKEFKLHVCDNLTELPQLEKLPNLENFHIGHLPQLKSINGNIVFSPSLQSISLIEGIEISAPDKKVNINKKLVIQNESYLKHLIANPTLFPNLEDLQINNIQECELSSGIGVFSKLKQIRVWDIGNLKNLFKGISNCTDLQSISLNNSKLTTFSSLRNLANLKFFNVHHCDQLQLNTDLLPNNIEEVDINFSHAIIFGDLPFKANKFKGYANKVKQFENIGNVLDTHKLDLYFTESPIENLPNSISEMNNLIDFKFHGRLSKVKDVFSSLQKLEKLDISGFDGSYMANVSSHLIEDFEPFHLPNLTTFRLASFSGGNLDQILSQLHNIISLEIQDVKNYDVLSCEGMPQLEKIKLYKCDFKQVNVNSDIKIFDASFCHNLGNNAFNEICSWKSLEELYISWANDEVQTLPESLKELKLSTLKLNYIKLKEIPGFIGNIKTLKVLYLEGFYIDDLPNSLAFLPNLEYLSITSTTFRKKLHQDFKNLKIKELKLFISKFGGNNMKTEFYEPLITPNFTKIVRTTFDFEEKH